MSLKKIFISAALICANVMAAMSSEPQGNVEKYDGWEKVINAIIQVESKGDPNAYNKNGDCCGILQIRPVLVKDVNRILGYEKYSLQDRFDPEKSKEMFVIIQRNYNKKKDVNLAIRMWNVGTVAIYDKNKGAQYYDKVMQYYK